MEQPGSRLARWASLGAIAIAAAAAVIWGARSGVGPAEGLASISAVGRTIVVEVRNASGRPGLARQVTRLLREKGVDVIYFGTAAAATDSTTVLVRRGDQSRGHQIARLLGRARVVMAADSLLRLDATVLLGGDYRLPKDRFPL